MPAPRTNYRVSIHTNETSIRNHLILKVVRRSSSSRAHLRRRKFVPSLLRMALILCWPKAVRYPSCQMRWCTRRSGLCPRWGLKIKEESLRMGYPQHERMALWRKSISKSWILEIYSRPLKMGRAHCHNKGMTSRGPRRDLSCLLVGMITHGSKPARATPAANHVWTSRESNRDPSNSPHLESPQCLRSDSRRTGRSSLSSWAPASRPLQLWPG